jgi:hypothetical protein
LRRQGKCTDGRALFRALQPVGSDVPLVALAIANSYWTQGNVADAVGPYKAALAGYTSLTDTDGMFAARIGLSSSKFGALKNPQGVDGDTSWG